MASVALLINVVYVVYVGYVVFGAGKQVQKDPEMAKLYRLFSDLLITRLYPGYRLMDCVLSLLQVLISLTGNLALPAVIVQREPRLHGLTDHCKADVHDFIDVCRSDGKQQLELAPEADGHFQQLRMVFCDPTRLFSYRELIGIHDESQLACVRKLVERFAQAVADVHHPGHAGIL